MEFHRTEAELKQEIRGLQARVSDLRFHESYQAISTGSLTPGCEICTRMAHMVVQLGFRCNARCPFCFLDVTDSGSADGPEDSVWKGIFQHFDSRKHTLEGVSFSGGEPLLYMADLDACVTAMRQARPDLYFWIYTNGILADEEHLNRLAELGISEIRFNLAATDYGSQVVKNVERARGGFEYVVVEVPAYPKQKAQLLACLRELDRIGIDQLNLQELLITNANMRRLDGEGYATGMLHLKKYFLYGSRRMTYEVMEHCREHAYGFTVNDCSAGQFGKRLNNATPCKV